MTDTVYWVYGTIFTLCMALFGVFLRADYHFLALLSLAAALSAVAMSGAHRFGRASLGPMVAAGIFMLAGIADTYWGPSPRPETETHGWLMPADDPSAETDCPNHPWGFGANVEVANRTLTVALGHTGAVIPSYGRLYDAKLPTKHVIISVGRCDAFAIDRQGSGLLIDADIFDKNGNLTARIQSNEFHLVPAQYSYMERPDRSTLVVYDKEGAELFWVRFLNPRSVKIRGRFACKGSQPVQVTDDAILAPGGRIRDSCFKVVGGPGLMFP